MASQSRPPLAFTCFWPSTSTMESKGVPQSARNQLDIEHFLGASCISLAGGRSVAPWTMNARELRCRLPLGEAFRPADEARVLVAGGILVLGPFDVRGNQHVFVPAGCEIVERIDRIL